MSIAYALLILTDAMAFLILFVPFGVLAAAETVCKEPWHPWELSPRAEQAVARMTRWHIVAAILVLASALVIPLRLALDVGASDAGSLAAARSSPDVVMPLIEAALWLVSLSAVFGPMYAVRLHVQRVHRAELIGLGVCLFPSTLLAVTLFELGSAPTSLLAFGIMGVVLFPLGAVIPARWVKTVLLTSACAAMLVTLADYSIAANPVWLLAAIAMGYTVFRAETKHLFMARVANYLATAHATLPNPTQVSLTTSKFRAVVFIAVNVACVLALLLMWRIGFGADASLQTVVFALTAISIATLGALATALVPTAFGHSRSEIDYAVSTFVLALATASVLHLIATPEVEGWASGNSQAAQIWKPVLGTFACVGALTIALTTVTGKVRQIRPFMIAIVLPAASLLPSGSFFTFALEESLISWTQRLIETGITVIILAIMWYVFGPGRRTESGLTVAASQVDGESSAMTDPSRSDPTADTVTDGRRLHQANVTSWSVFDEAGRAEAQTK